MELHTAIQGTAKRLAAAGVENAAAEARWLVCHAAGIRAARLLLEPDAELPAAAATCLAGLVERRCRREPLQYILGTQDFLGLTLRVTPAVLIPRPETETLVRIGLAALRGAFPDHDLQLADMGTGSGCIAIALAHLDRRCRVVATDISDGALAVAAANAATHGVAARLLFVQGDGLEALLRVVPQPARFHGVFSNPPYVAAAELAGLQPEVRDFEPHLALSPGPDGLAFYRHLAETAPGLLHPGGLLAVEVGSGQADRVGRLMAEHGLRSEVHPDPWGAARVVLGWKGDPARAGDAPAHPE